MVDQNSHKGFSQEIQQFLNELDTISWFQNIGRPIDEQKVKQVFSWQEAWECLTDDSWADASFQDKADPKHPVWPNVYDNVYQAVSKSGHNYEFEPNIDVASQAAWDAAGAAYQVATGNQEGFFVKLMEWYRKGHFPCGWDGDYPDGKLIVF